MLQCHTTPGRFLVLPDVEPGTTEKNRKANSDGNEKAVDRLFPCFKSPLLQERSQVQILDEPPIFGPTP